MTLTWALSLLAQAAEYCECQKMYMTRNILLSYVLEIAQWIEFSDLKRKSSLGKLIIHLTSLITKIEKNSRVSIFQSDWNELILAYQFCAMVLGTLEL